MNVTHLIRSDQGLVDIKINGRFDFHSYAQLREAYRINGFVPRLYRLDFSDVTYIDSSGLGQLLILFEHAKQIRAQIQLIHVSKEIHQLLGIARMDKLMIVEAA